jgi:penicillin amidase
MIAMLQAYAEGVNSFLDEAESAGRLPPEYAGLGLASVKRWTTLDSVLVGKALAAQTSLIVTDDIDLTLALGTYETVGDQSGLFDGTALFFEDLFRNAPFDRASTVPDAMQDLPPQGRKSDFAAWHARMEGGIGRRAMKHGDDYRKRIRKLPRVPGAMRLDGNDMGGSNSWVVAGRHTSTGKPLLANDIHLALESPAIFHELHLVGPNFRVTGSSLPGAPCVLRGHNKSIAWGITNARLDVSDLFLEVIVQDPASPSGFATLHRDEQGNLTQEPILPLLEQFSANVNGELVHQLTQPLLIVPRRNQGPLLAAPEPMDSPPVPGALSALSVQSVGFGPTRDPEGICEINRAKNLGEFKAALQLVDFASQNFTYADRKGNIAYFISGELPLRVDLQGTDSQNPPAIPPTPPFLIRNGFSGNDWIPVVGSQAQNQATPFEILPFDEMPQLVNPPSGFVVTANNDQAGNTLDNNPLNDFRDGGNGLRYLNWGGRNFSIRAGRITEMLGERLSHGSPRLWWRNRVSFADMKKMQADTLLSDARILTPYILQAYDNASGAAAHPALAAIAAEPRIGEAVERLRQWGFTTPTSIPGGYDANPDALEIGASVATTIYSTWRGAMVANTIDATLDGIAQLANIPEMPRPGSREEVVTALKHLLENDGMGVSGLNFFNVDGVAGPALRRDIIVLASLADALDQLASDAFSPAFGNSVNQDDYRWGKLHRLVLEHPLGDVELGFNVPPAFGFFPPAADGIDGIPVDGGFETVDEAPPKGATNIRVSDSRSFAFEFGPIGRFVARPDFPRIYAETSLPGGESSIPGSPYYVNLLEPWLRNGTFRMLTSRRDIKHDASSIEDYVP